MKLKKLVGGIVSALLLSALVASGYVLCGAGGSTIAYKFTPTYSSSGSLTGYNVQGGSYSNGTFTAGGATQDMSISTAEGLADFLEDQGNSEC